MLPKITLVLGGASSGKSAFAERLVRSGNGRAVYIATAQGFDIEMSERIERHKQDRGNDWVTIEEPLNVSGALAALHPDDVVLFDCLTMWLSNHMGADSELAAEQDRLIEALSAATAPVVVVSNEVGLGGVPQNALARRFGQLQGRLNTAVGAKADLVVCVMAGMPLVLKGVLPEGMQ